MYVQAQYKSIFHATDIVHHFREWNVHAECIKLIAVVTKGVTGTVTWKIVQKVKFGKKDYPWLPMVPRFWQYWFTLMAGYRLRSETFSLPLLPFEVFWHCATIPLIFASLKQYATKDNKFLIILDLIIEQ